MKIRLHRVLLLVALAAEAAVAGSAPTAPSGRFLSPPEVAQIVKESEVMYRIATGMEGLEGVNPANTIDWLFPLSAPQIVSPWRLEKADGSAEVVEFPFHPGTRELFDEAESHFLGRRYPQAVSGYQKVIDQFPDCYLAYAHMGDAYYKMKQCGTAIEYYDIAIGLNPWDHRTFLYKADALMHLDRHEEAKAAYIHSLSLRPRYWLALANLQHSVDTLGIEVRTDLFQPQAFVRRENEVIGVYVGDRESIMLWLPYALTKAIWLGEPWHREEMLGDSTHKWSSVEETEALLNLIIVYKQAKQDGRVQADPKLDLLEEIVDARDLQSFICYEIASRLCPHITLTLTEEARQSLREFIAKYVVVSRPKPPVETPGPKVAATAILPTDSDSPAGQ